MRGPSRLIVAGVVALLVAGCSITSRDSHQGDITDHMRCTAAHDEFHDDGDGGPVPSKVVTICDHWVPVAVAS